MAQFQDTEGREWVVRIDLFQLRTVRERLKVNIGRWAGIEQASEDPVFLADLLYLLCEEQAKAKAITPEMFGRALAGDVIVAGFEALQEAYLDFCPSREREARRLLLAKSRELEEADHRERMKRIEAIAGAELSKITNATDGNSAESSESTPTGPD